MLMTTTTETYFSTAKLLKKVIDIIKFEKHFINSTTDTQELIVKYNIGLKTLLQQGISEPICYGDLVIHSEELLENLILVIASKRLSNVIKQLDRTWISCDSLHAWL